MVTGWELEECTWPNATEYPVCPCSGYDAVRGQLGFNTLYDSVAYSVSSVTANSIGINFLTLDQWGVMSPILSTGHVRGSSANDSSYFCQPNLYTASTQQLLLRDWFSATYSSSAATGSLLNSIRDFKYGQETAIFSNSTFPITFVKCTKAQNLTQDNTTLGFHYIQSQPIYPGGWSSDGDTWPVNISHLNLDLTSHVRTQWLSLDQNKSGLVTTGLLFEHPWSQPSNSRLVSACSVTAAWTYGSIQI